MIGPPISRMFVDGFCRDCAYREHHDNEPSGANRSDRTGQSDPRKATDPCFNRHASNAADLFLTIIIPVIGEHAKLPESPASKSSGAPSRASRLGRAWALRANFANGSTYRGSESDHGLHFRSNLVAGDRGGTTQCRPTGRIMVRFK
jgi:hypothetical protein